MLFRSIIQIGTTHVSDLSKLPPEYPIVPFQVHAEIEMVKLAREIALGIQPLAEILDRHGVDDTKWAKLVKSKRFSEILTSEIQAWESATNTSSRVKVKAGTMLEEWLPELYARMQDKSEPLMAKIKAGELISRLAGFGEAAAKVIDPADRVSITINLGSDTKLEFQKPRSPTKAIDNETAEPVTGDNSDEAILVGEENAGTD